jgi:2Fe-2S ferredoxin
VITINVIDREGNAHKVEGQTGDRLMEVLREFDWGVEAICGGMCSCATCHVYVAEAWQYKFTEADMDESELVDFLDFKQEHSRLSCQLELSSEHDGLEITLAPEE